MKEKLLQLQKDIYNFETQEDPEDYFIGYSPKLYFFPVGDLYDIYFYGDGNEEDPTVKAVDFEYESNFPFYAVLDFLCNQENADKIVSLTFDGPDEGANGTKNWDFSRIIDSGVEFPNLKSLKIQLTNLGDHNQNIIDTGGGSMEEGGTVARLLAKMPALETLAIPSAPDKSFFEIGRHPLKRLIVQAGCDNQNFIGNFADSNNFYQLASLDFTDLIDVYDIPDDNYVSFESFKKLFTSQAFSTVKHFKLRNSILTEEQLFELQKLSNVQFLYINAKGGRYVSHLMNKQK